MTEQTRTRLVCPLADGLPPVRGRLRELDLGGDDLDQPVEDLILATDIVIQRGGFDAQLAREAAHGHGLDPLAVPHGQGYLQRPLPVHGRPARRLSRPTAHDVSASRVAQSIDNLTALGYTHENNLTPLGTSVLLTPPEGQAMTTLSTTSSTRAPLSSMGNSISRRTTATIVGVLFVVQMVTAMFGTSLMQAFVDGDTDRVGRPSVSS